jgi:acetyl-CoA acetyltransferase
MGCCAGPLVGREGQDAFALKTQQHATRFFADEIAPVEIADRKDDTRVYMDEHPRPETTCIALAKLKQTVRPDSNVTAGHVSGVNGGATMVLVASQEAARCDWPSPGGPVLGMTTAGMKPRTMGICPVPASRKLMDRLGIDRFDVIEQKHLPVR